MTQATGTPWEVESAMVTARQRAFWFHNPASGVKVLKTETGGKETFQAWLTIEWLSAGVHARGETVAAAVAGLIDKYEKIADVTRRSTDNMRLVFTKHD